MHRLHVILDHHRPGGKAARLPTLLIGHRTHAGRQGHPPVTGVNANRSLANLRCVIDGRSIVEAYTKPRLPPDFNSPWTGFAHWLARGEVNQMPMPSGRALNDPCKTLPYIYTKSELEGFIIAGTTPARQLGDVPEHLPFMSTPISAIITAASFQSSRNETLRCDSQELTYHFKSTHIGGE